LALVFDAIDSLVSNDLQSGQYGNRSIVRTKGGGTSSYLTTDSLVTSNNNPGFADRKIVRTSKGVLYIGSRELTSNDVNIHKSDDDGATWTLLDSANEPNCDKSTVCLSIDSNDLIHVAFYEETVGLRYVTFSTVTDTYGTPETAQAELGTLVETGSNRFVSLALDSNDKPHVVYTDHNTGSGDECYYTNKVSGSWSTKLLVIGDISLTYTHGQSITFNNSDIPQIALIWHNATDIDSLRVYLGNQNSATSFSETILDTTTAVDEPSMVVTDNNDTIVSYTDSNDDVIAIRHVNGNTWATWETAVVVDSSTVFANAQLTIDEAGDIYIFSADLTGNTTNYWKSTNGGRTFGAIQTDNMAGITENRNYCRWQKYNHHFPNRIDYLAYDTVADDIYFNIVENTLTGRWRSTDVEINGNVHGTFNRALVRTSKGVMYALLHDFINDDIEMHKSTDEGFTWTHLDATNDPTVTQFGSLAIDSNDLLHITFLDNNVGQRYTTFSTSTDTWSGTFETILASVGFSNVGQSCEISIDSNDIPHIAFGIQTGASATSIRYNNRIGGTWTSNVTIASSTSDRYQARISMNHDNKPYVVVIANKTTDDIIAYQGNQNDATSFSSFTVSTSLSQIGGDMVINSRGDVFVCWTNSSSDFIIKRHLFSDAWSTWQTDETLDTGINADSRTMTINNEGLVIAMTNRSQISYAYRENLDGGWSLIDTSHNPPETNVYLNNFRWSFYNYYFPSQVDYLREAGFDGQVDYNKIVFNGTDLLYCVGRNPTSNQVETWYSGTNGNTWEILDSANEPTCDVNSVSCCIDGIDDVHIAFEDAGVGTRYIKLDSSTQLYTTVETIQAEVQDPVYQGTAIACDHSDIPHCVYNFKDGIIGDVNYSNRIGGTWKAGVLVQTVGSNANFPQIIINVSNIPVLLVPQQSAGSTIWEGNLNDATSFTSFNIGNMTSTCMVMDSIGNFYTASQRGTATVNDLEVSRHNVEDAWTTWQTAVLVENQSWGTINSPSMTVDKKNNIILMMPLSGSIRAHVSTDEGATWETVVTDDIPGVVDEHVRLRYDGTHFHNRDQIDYTVTDDTANDTYYNSAQFLAVNTITKSISIDAILQETRTKTVSFDANLLEVQTKNVTIDSLLQATFTKNVSFDARVGNPTKTVSIDAVLQNTLTKTVSMDAIIGVPCSELRLRTLADRSSDTFRLRTCDEKEAGGATTKTVSFDAILQQTFTKNVSIDARILQKFTKAISIDAKLLKSITKAVSFDSILKQVRSKAVSVDALLRNTFTKNVSLDALLSKVFTKSVSLDAILQQTRTKLVSLDARLINKISKSVSIDALLQELRTKLVSIDARLVNRFSKSVSIDARLLQLRTKIVSLDARLVNVRSKLITLDALLQQARTKNVSFDSRLVNRLTKNISLDALLQQINSKIVSLDALLQETRTKLVSMDAILTGATTKSVTFDAILQQLRSKVVSIDARLINRLTKNVSLDARLINRITKNISVDSILVNRFTKAVSLDSILVNRLTKNVSIDALLKQLQSKVVSIDALLRNTFSKNVSLDAILQQTRTKLVSLDSILLKTQSKIVSLDARLINKVTKAISLDAFLQETFTKLVSIDSILVNRITKNISIDALLQQVRTKAVSLDARLVNRLTKSVSIDAFLQQLLTKTVSFDARLINRLTKNISLDALLQQLRTKAVSIDAILRETFTKNISLDAILQQLQTKSVSLDAILQKTQSKIVSLDARLVNRFTKSVSLDSRLINKVTKAISLDSILVNRLTKAVSLDARLVNKFTKAVSLDSILQKTFTKAVSIDARLGSFFTKLVSFDAVLQQIRSKSVSIDALLQAVRTKAVSLDAVLANRLTKDISIDAFLQTSFNKLVSLDAVLAEVKSKIVSMDAFLQEARSKAVSLDALLQTSFTKAVSMDGRLAGVSTKSVSIDALLQALRTKVISLDAFLQTSFSKIVSMDALLKQSLTKSASIDAKLKALNTQKQISLDAVLEFFEPLSEITKVDLTSQSIDDIELTSQSIDDCSLTGEAPSDTEIGEPDLTISLISQSIDVIDVEEIV